MSRGLLRQIVLNCSTNSCYYYKVFFSFTPSPHVFHILFSILFLFSFFFFRHSSLKWNRHQRIFYYRISLSLPSGGKNTWNFSIYLRIRVLFFFFYIFLLFFFFFTSFSFCYYKVTKWCKRKSLASRRRESIWYAAQFHWLPNPRITTNQTTQKYQLIPHSIAAHLTNLTTTTKNPSSTSIRIVFSYIYPYYTA